MWRRLPYVIHTYILYSYILFLNGIARHIVSQKEGKDLCEHFRQYELVVTRESIQKSIPLKKFNGYLKLEKIWLTFINSNTITISI